MGSAPVYFLCPKARQQRSIDRMTARLTGVAPKRERHTITRTGRTKPNPSHNRTSRSLGEMHEYICSCGHRGWTVHADVLRHRLEDGAMLSLALEVASTYHSGQVRKFDGSPYIQHPQAVAQLVADNGGSIEQRVAALLHDVVEDTDATLEDIRRIFGKTVAEIVDALSHREGESHADAVLRAATTASGRAWLVKRCDVIHNMSTLPPGHKLHERYIRALEILHANAPKES